MKYNKTKLLDKWLCSWMFQQCQIAIHVSKASPSSLSLSCRRLSHILSLPALEYFLQVRIQVMVIDFDTQKSLES